MLKQPDRLKISCSQIKSRLATFIKFVGFLLAFTATFTQADDAISQAAAGAGEQFKCTGNPIESSQIEYSVKLFLNQYNDHLEDKNLKVEDIVKTYKLNLLFLKNQKAVKSDITSLCKFEYILEFVNPGQTLSSYLQPNSHHSDFKVKFAYVNNTLKYDEIEFYKYQTEEDASISLDSVFNPFYADLQADLKHRHAEFDVDYESDTRLSQSLNNPQSVEHLNILKTDLFYLDSANQRNKTFLEHKPSSNKKSLTPIGFCQLDYDQNATSINSDVHQRTYHYNFHINSTSCVRQKADTIISCQSNLIRYDDKQQQEKSKNIEIDCQENFKFEEQNFVTQSQILVTENLELQASVDAWMLQENNKVKNYFDKMYLKIDVDQNLELGAEDSEIDPNSGINQLEFLESSENSLTLSEPTLFYQPTEVNYKSYKICYQQIHDLYSESRNYELFYPMGMTCCLMNTDYEKISALKSNLGKFFESRTNTLYKDINLIKRSNSLCEGDNKVKGMSKTDLINVGIRHCRSRFCHDFIYENINHVDIFTALDWIHGISLENYNNNTEYLKSASQTLFKLLPQNEKYFKKSSRSSNYADYIQKKCQDQTNLDLMAYDISMSFGTLMNRIDSQQQEKISLEWEDFLMEKLDKNFNKYQAVVTEEYLYVKVLLTAVGATGSHKMQSLLLKYMNMEEHSVNVYDNRYFSVEAIRNIPCYKLEREIKEKLFEILEDEDEDSEIRIAAYRRLREIGKKLRILG